MLIDSEEFRLVLGSQMLDVIVGYSNQCVVRQ